MRKRMMASAVMAATFLIATGFAQGAGVGHVFTLPIGPALKFKPGGAAVWVGGVQVQPKEGIEFSEDQGEEAVETGKVPESKEFESNEAAVEEVGERACGKEIDTCP